MSYSTNDHRTNSLPAELELALRHATSEALTALHSLRLAVRDHVHTECARGSTQNEIEDGLRSIIDECGPSLTRVDSAGRAEDVTRQVLKWSAAFYKTRPKR